MTLKALRLAGAVVHREKIFHAYSREVPYSCEVAIKAFKVSRACVPLPLLI